MTDEDVLDRLLNELRGKTFGALILKRADEGTLQGSISALQEYVAQLPPSVRANVAAWLDQVGEDGALQEFWRREAAAVFLDTLRSAERTLRTWNIEPSAKQQVTLAQIMVTNFVYGIHTHSDSREFIRIAIGDRPLRSARTIVMHPGTALVVTLIVGVWGTIAHHPHLWIPYSGILASVLSLPTRRWVRGDAVGQWATVGACLKFLFALAWLYAFVAAIGSIAVAVGWMIRS